MSGDVKPKRRYESKRRLEQAQETRRAILAAAKQRFESDGYAATTVAEIAADAGVATKTVYLAFESKGGVLRALWNLLLRGEQDDRPVAEQEWYREVLEEPDPERQLRLNARNSAQGKQRISSILEVIRSAASTDPEIDVLWQRIQSDYRENQRAIVEQLAKRKALSPGPRRRACRRCSLDDQQPEHVAAARRAARLDARAVRAVVRRRSLPGAARRAMKRVLRVGLAVLVALFVLGTLAAFAIDVSPLGAARPARSLYAGPYVQVGPTLVAYRRWGRRGSPIVLLGGAAEPAWVWHAVGPRLAAGGHRVFASTCLPSATRNGTSSHRSTAGCRFCTASSSGSGSGARFSSGTRSAQASQRPRHSPDRALSAGSCCSTAMRCRSAAVAAGSPMHSSTRGSTPP